VDRLEKDLAIYERDVTKNQRSGQFAAEIAERETKLTAAQEELRLLMFERGKLQTECDQAQRKVETSEETFRRQGGELFARRKELATQRESIRTQRERIEGEMREVAAGITPLILVEAQIKKLRSQAMREEAADHQKVLLAELKKRDQAILRACRFTGPQRNKLESLFAEDRKRRERTAEVERYLNLDKSAMQVLQRLGATSFGEVRQRIVSFRREHRFLSDNAVRIDDALSRVPDEAAIAQSSEQLAEAREGLLRRQIENGVLLDRIEKLRHRINEDERIIASILERNIEESAAHDDASRKVRFAAKIRDTMEKFRVRVLERKIKQIEDLILGSFQQLLRKKDLVSGIRIDSSNYRMTLFSSEGVELHADRLSAGERQLLAVSTLWGLARASGRPLPTIIDTPLGRLDSHHRANLVESYFPFASHQVIILSTDEEIGLRHLAKLKPHISQSFELSYSSKTKSTNVVPGYFFN
jgi:DNA sulfur modification protein DndD